MKKVLVSLFALVSLAVSAQTPFFGKTWLQPPAQPGSKTVIKNRLIATPITAVVPTDTTFYQLKPLVGLAYSFPNYQAQVVTGLSYQHVKYKYQTAATPTTPAAPAETYIDYAFNLLYSAGGSTADKEADTDISSFGIGIGVLNKTLAFNLLFNRYRDPLKPDEKKKLKPVFAIMYSF